MDAKQSRLVVDACIIYSLYYKTPEVIIPAGAALKD